jgi:hypothetical protein
MKIKDAHGTPKLGPTMFAGEKDRPTNKNENQPDARPQQQQPSFPILSEKF